MFKNRWHTNNNLTVDELNQIVLFVFSKLVIVTCVDARVRRLYHRDSSQQLAYDDYSIYMPDGMIQSMNKQVREQLRQLDKVQLINIILDLREQIVELKAIVQAQNERIRVLEDQASRSHDAIGWGHSSLSSNCEV
jgi:hypothetical protein